MITQIKNISRGREATNEKVIVIENLKKAFGSNLVLNDFTFSLANGENVAVLGKSGSGKSVLIKCIIGLLETDAGTINVLGYNVPDLNIDELDQLRIQIGFLFQSNALYDSMTVKENLEFPLRRHSMNMDQHTVDTMVEEALEDVGLGYTINMMPVELSGGMRKRVALARTLILKPRIILYDEPTTGLDPITGKEISNLIVEIQQKYNTSSFIISHDMKCIKLTADRILVLIDGKCYAVGTYDELKSSKDIRIKEFFD